MMKIRKSQRLGQLFASVAFILSLMLPAIAQGRALTGCAGHTPPFVIAKDGKGVSGFSVELFQYVANHMQQESSIKELPWARCLAEVKAGRVDLAIDAYDDADRRKIFLYSNPYHTLTPQVFFMGTTSATGLPPTTVDDLKRLNGCGVFDYTYEHYDLEATKMDLGAKNDMQMIKKLMLGRCDYAVEELEYIIGERQSNKDWPDEVGVQSIRPAWARGPKVHFLIGRARPDAQPLLKAVNAAIANAETSGTLKSLRDRYFGNLGKSTGKP